MPSIITPSVAATLILCAGTNTEDHLFDVETGAHRVCSTPDGLLLRGYDEESAYADDLYIRPEAGGWRLYYRAPSESDWRDGGYHAEWSSLVGFAYSL